MKNPWVLAVVAGAVLILVAIGGEVLLSWLFAPRVDPMVAAMSSGKGQQVEDMMKDFGGVKKTQAKVMMGILDKSLREYQVQVGETPSNLNSLYELPSDLADKSRWVRKLDKPVPNDPWGNPYNYGKSSKTFRIWSNGPDGQYGTDDDIEYKR
ncbi:MAG: type II secretion system protein GspG [Pirellula sp.]|nr:type II secretion system protein GspG [Pirellula sp.]